MGNCIRHESPMQWGGDDWGAILTPVRYMDNEDSKPPSSSSSSAAAATSTEVKIKITRKQLEELLGRVDMKELSVNQVIALLMVNRGDEFETNQKAWRPKLQSIPESS